MKKGVALCGMMALLLAACATFTPKNVGKAFMFSLKPAQVGKQAAVPKRLIVVLPTTSPELDTYRIALVRGSGAKDYYADARWADFLPVLVQDSVIKTLERAGAYEAITSGQTGLEGDLALKIEIRGFQAEYAAKGAPPSIHIRMVVSLLDRLDRTVIKSFEADSGRVKASGTGLPAIHAAFNTAFGVVQQQMLQKLTSFDLKPQGVIQ
jgi:ABC-type uncharacterized transport system auxiliary subunit